MIAQAKNVRLCAPVVMSFGQDMVGRDSKNGFSMIPQEEIFIATLVSNSERYSYLSGVYNGCMVYGVVVLPDDWILIYEDEKSVPG